MRKGKPAPVILTTRLHLGKKPERRKGMEFHWRWAPVSMLFHEKREGGKIAEEEEEARTMAILSRRASDEKMREERRKKKPPEKDFYGPALLTFLYSDAVPERREKKWGGKS